MPIFSTEEEEQVYLRAKQLLFQLYEPGSATRMSTQEIFRAMQAHLPSNYYAASDVAAWLLEGNFTTASVGDMHMEWMLKKRAQ